MGKDPAPGSRFGRRFMSRAGLFWKLFISTALLATIAIAAVLVVVSVYLREQAWHAFDKRLDHVAATTAVAAARDWPGKPTPAVQATLRQVARETGIRVTLIDRSGRVLGDSQASNVAEAAIAENLASRVEIVEARRHGAGWATRRSKGSDRQHRYRSRRISRGGQPLGYVRTAAPVSRLRQEMMVVEQRVWTIGGLVTALAVLGVFVAINYLVRPLAAIQEAVQAMVGGDYQVRLPLLTQAKNETSRAIKSLAEVGQRLSQRENELQRTLQIQTTVLESMNESVLAVNRQYRILFANRSARLALRFVDPSQDNATLLEAVRSHELKEMAEQVLATEQIVRQRWRPPDRQPRTYDVLATPLPGEPCQGVLFVLHDISELSRLEEMRQRFVADVSHELKTPLSSIKAYTETLLSGTVDDDAQHRHFLSRIEEQANRLQQLIQDMLSLARIESGQVPQEHVQVRLAPVVARCLADHRRLAETQQVALTSEIEEDDLAIRGEEESLRQILDNLINNAVKYTPAGGKVVVAVRRRDNSVELTVADTGVGIAPEHHPRLFQRFYRVDKARSRELGGTGLGLSIVKHLCGTMGGSVAVESEVGKGSTFCVSLPLAGAPSGAVEK